MQRDCKGAGMDLQIIKYKNQFIEKISTTINAEEKGQNFVKCMVKFLELLRKVTAPPT